MYCIPLAQATDRSQAGSKAANLAQAIQLGFPVPGGLVVLRSALRAFLESNGFLPAVQDSLSQYAGAGRRERLRRFESLRATALALPIPSQVRSEVGPLLLDLLARSPAGVAVRSSGACEDLDKASFAGVYDSFLGITALEPFWQSVLRCWCSAWSPQAAAYADRMGLSIPLDGMSVLVQAMVPAECSGVAFTADPVSGNPWRFVLNATFGLASRLVEGAAPADRYVLAWDTSEILERHIENKPDAVVFRGGRVRRVALPERQRREASLPDDALGAVGRLALAVDRAFDRRMDLEWAFASGELYLLQARPLTALPPFFPHELSPAEAQQTWTPSTWYGRLNAQERLVAPFYSERRQLELWQRFLSPGDIFPRPVAQERDFRGYRYATPWQWQGSPLGWPQVEPWLDEHEPRLRRDWLAQLERVRQANAWADDEMGRLAEDLAAPASAWVRLLLAYDRAEAQMQAAVWYAPQWLIFTCEKLLAQFVAEAMAGHGIPDLVPGLLQGLSCYSVERTIAAQALGRGVQEPAVRAAFAQQPLSEVLCYLYREHPTCSFIRAMADFCRSYGMELPSPGEAQSSPGLDLGGVLMVVKASIMGQGIDAAAALAQAAAHRRAPEEQAAAWLRQRRPDQHDRFHKLLAWAQFWTPALDDRKWHVTVTARRALLVRLAGEALVRAGLVDRPDHLLLLTPDDWAAYVERPDADALRSLYRQRQHDYERDRRLEPPPYLGKPPAAKEEQSGSARDGAIKAPADRPAARRVYHGQAIAPGVARGIAYKVSDLDDVACLDNLTDQHILICGRDSENAQWRRDWYSLFMVVRGLVTVQGAQLHHATQIARECGLPYINLPADELAGLPDGCAVEIDGQAGTLTVL